MKRYIIAIFIISLLFSLCGCRKENTEEIYAGDYSEQVIISTDIEFGDTGYNIETDSQNYFNLSTRDIAVSPDGYYAFGNRVGENKRLMFIDKETKKCIPVCSKADCKHNTDECDAYFPVFMDNISYYKGILYTVLTEPDANNYGFVSYSLYKISLDGSVCERVFEMFYADSDSVVPQFIIHRGYVYYTSAANGEYCLYRRGFDEKKARLLYRVSDKDWGASIGGMKGYGDGVLFAVQLNAGCGNQVIYYSQNTNELYEISYDIGGGWTFAVLEDGIVYYDGENIKKTSFKDLKTEIFIEDASGEVTYDGKYIYIDNLHILLRDSGFENTDYSERKIDVYDINGNYVDTIDLSGNSYFSRYGDEDSMFFTFDNGETCIFDKSQIGTGSHEWIKIDGL